MCRNIGERARGHRLLPDTPGDAVHAPRRLLPHRHHRYVPCSVPPLACLPPLARSALRSVPLLPSPACIFQTTGSFSSSTGLTCTIRRRPTCMGSRAPYEETPPYCLPHRVIYPTPVPLGTYSLADCLPFPPFSRRLAAAQAQLDH